MTTDKFYVHYTVKMPPKLEIQRLTAGPYSADEALSAKQDISHYAHVSEAFISGQAEHPNK